MDLTGFTNKEWRGFSDVDISKIVSRGKPGQTTSPQRECEPSQSPEHHSRDDEREEEGKRGEEREEGGGEREEGEEKRGEEEKEGGGKRGEEEKEGEGEGRLNEAEGDDTQNVAQFDLKESPTHLNIMIRQKLQEEIKEENKKKKKLIELTLQERYSQSQQETERLRKVQAELVTLDKLVTQDVSMLRERIEEASRTLNNARWRFETAEKEYVSAKIQLHKAEEQKALLSEHLCTVIHETETRKAKKLLELCQTLSIDSREGPS